MFGQIYVVLPSFDAGTEDLNTFAPDETESISFMSRNSGCISSSSSSSLPETSSWFDWTTLPSGKM